MRGRWKHPGKYFVFRLKSISRSNMDGPVVLICFGALSNTLFRFLSTGEIINTKNTRPGMVMPSLSSTPNQRLFYMIVMEHCTHFPIVRCILSHNRSVWPPRRPQKLCPCMKAKTSPLVPKKSNWIGRYLKNSTYLEYVSGAMSIWKAIQPFPQCQTLIKWNSILLHSKLRCRPSQSKIVTLTLWRRQLWVPKLNRVPYSPVWIYQRLRISHRPRAGQSTGEKKV